MMERLVSILIGYTFHSDVLRNAFREEIDKDFPSLTMENESLYSCDSTVDSVSPKLGKIIQEIIADNEGQLDKDDFVCLIYSAHMGNYKGSYNQDKVVVQKIYPKE